MPSITRRQLLGGGAALAVGGYGGYRLLEGAPAAEFDDWQPEAGTWPLPRYDPANTAHNPYATPPRESPERREVTSVRASVRPLVGTDRIVLYDSTLASYSPGTDDVTYLAETETRYAGLGPLGDLSAVQRVEATTNRIAVVSYDDRQETSRTSLGEIHPNSLVVGRSEVYVGTSQRNLIAVDAGEVDWRVDGMMPALVAGKLYAAGATDGVIAYGERSGLDGAISPKPKVEWRGRWARGSVHRPAVANDRFVVGSHGLEPEGNVSAYDAETGDRLWEPRNLGMAAATPAVVGDRGYTAVGTDGLEAGRVVALDLGTGDTLWEDETDWYAHSPVVSGDTLVVLGDVRRTDVPGDGVVRAYDTASGEELWTVSFERLAPNYGGVALVGDRVLVTVGTTLYELSHPR